MPDSSSNHQPLPPKDFILVTGSTGLIGNELIRQLLQKGFSVKAVYNKTPLPVNDNKNLYPISCDLLDVVTLEEAMENVSAVYHCAGLVSFSPKKTKELYYSNVVCTANVVNACLSAGVKKLVQVSSVAAMGRNKESASINESMQWSKETNPSKYARSKHLAEMEVWRGVAEGLEAAIVNPTIILGAGKWENGSTAIFKNVYNEFRWYSNGVNGFVDVRDVCKAMICLMESNVTGERFIISAENKRYQDLFNLIADTFKKKRPSWKVTPLLAQLVWRWEWLKMQFSKKDPLITKETAATALAASYYDNTKFKKAFPDFKYYSLEETIEHTCKTLQQKLNIP